MHATATRFRTHDRRGFCIRAESCGSLGAGGWIQVGGQVGWSPEGLSDEVEGMGAIPVWPVVGVEGVHERTSNGVFGMRVGGSPYRPIIALDTAAIPVYTMDTFS